MEQLSSPIRIVLADESELFRDGFCLLFRGYSDIEVVGQAATGKDLIKLSKKLLPHIIVADIGLLLMKTIDGTKSVASRFPRMNIVALNISDDDQSTIDMLSTGAKGYLLKSARKNEIIDAIKTVHVHKTYYSEKISARLTHLVAQNIIDTHNQVQKPEFSAKEKEVIRLLCQEGTNKEISETLSLSIRTIEGYRENIQKKIGAKNSVGVAIYAIKNGMYKI